MAVKLAIFNGRAAWQPRKQITPLTWKGFSVEENPEMTRNEADGIVYRLYFDTPEPDNHYGVLVFVEDVARKQVKIGIIDERHTDYVQVSGGHVNGMRRNLIYTVLVFT